MVCTLVYMYFGSVRLELIVKTNFTKFRLLIQRYFQFWFLKKSSGTSFSTAFFKKNISHVTFYNWPNLVVWLLLLLELFGNMCILIIRLPVCDVMNFEINLSFLTKPFSYKTKNVKAKI